MGPQRPLSEPHRALHNDSGANHIDVTRLAYLFGLPGLSGRLLRFHALLGTVKSMTRVLSVSNPLEIFISAIILGPFANGRLINTSMTASIALSICMQ